MSKSPRYSLSFSEAYGPRVSKPCNSARSQSPSNFLSRSRCLSLASAAASHQRRLVALSFSTQEEFASWLTSHASMARTTRAFISFVSGMARPSRQAQPLPLTRDTMTSRILTATGSCQLDHPRTTHPALVEARPGFLQNNAEYHIATIKSCGADKVYWRVVAVSMLGM